jgi:hypothetical protein
MTGAIGHNIPHCYLVRYYPSLSIPPGSRINIKVEQGRITIAGIKKEDPPLSEMGTIKRKRSRVDRTVHWSGSLGVFALLAAAGARLVLHEVPPDFDFLEDLLLYTALGASIAAIISGGMIFDPRRRHSSKERRWAMITTLAGALALILALITLAMSMCAGPEVLVPP